MTLLGEFPSRVSANRERLRFIKAQMLIDQITALVIGEAVNPPAESVFQVVVDGDKFLLMYDDPSVTED